MNARIVIVALLVALVALATPAAAQSVHVDLGVGFQWLDISGNEDQYRSQTNEEEGLLLDTLTLSLLRGENGGVFDRLRLDASGFGANSDARLRLDVDRAGSYSLRLQYARSDVFSALPGYANPFVTSGLVPGQHTLDRTRESLNLDLELLPGKSFTPLVGYSRATYEGPAQTTYHVGEDEFRLASDLDETVDEFRVGVAFNLGGWRGAVLQGWRNTDASEHLSLAPGGEEGNSSRPVLGHQISADSIERQFSTSTETPFTTASVTGQLGKGIRLSGTFVRSDAGLDADGSETLTGDFASFKLRRFFGAASDTETGHAENPAWRGEARLEVELLRWLDVIAGYVSSHRELDGRSLVTTNYLDTLNFSGATMGDLTTVLEADTAWQRDEEAAQLKVVARPLQWLRLWGEASRVSQDVAIVAAAAEIVIPGGQEGSFQRDIDRLAAGAEVAFGPLVVSADWQSDDTNTAIVRADYLERDRLRTRATLKLGSWARLLATGEWIQASNPTSGIDYDAEISRYGGELEITPLEWLLVRGSYDRYESDSSMTIRRPQDFVLVPSLYIEHGDNVEASAAATFGRFKLEAGGNRYQNEGDIPFSLDRTFARFDVGLTSAVGVYGLIERREYSEDNLALADYEATRVAVFLRWAMN